MFRRDSLRSREMKRCCRSASLAASVLLLLLAFAPAVTTHPPVACTCIAPARCTRINITHYHKKPTDPTPGELYTSRAPVSFFLDRTPTTLKRSQHHTKPPPTTATECFWPTHYLQNFDTISKPHSELLQFISFKNTVRIKQSLILKLNNNPSTQFLPVRSTTKTTLIHEIRNQRNERLTYVKKIFYLFKYC